jgi:hypothetical protein
MRKLKNQTREHPNETAVNDLADEQRDQLANENEATDEPQQLLKDITKGLASEQQLFQTFFLFDIWIS